MARSGRGAAPRDIRALFHVGMTGGLTDEQLLEWFVARDREAAELAFAELVARHGPMVLRVCRTILHDPDEAEDAFQATFLVLARRANSIRKRASTASWLHGVARRVATSARLAAVRRRIHERRAAEMSVRSGDDAARDDLAELLHQELGRLSERYRTAIVLCDLEGLTEGQAAQRLGWPIGTVRSRLLRGRERLRGRLIRRGLAPSVVVLGSVQGSEAASIVVPPLLAKTTTQAAVQLASAGAVPAAVSALTEGVLRAMFLAKLKISGAALLAVAATSLLTIAAFEFTRTKVKATSPPHAQGQVQEKAGRAIPAPPAKTTPISTRTAAILTALDEPVAMNFASKTPLDDVLKYLKQATTTPTFSGLPFYVEPQGLREAGRSLNSTIAMNMENTPLKVTLPKILAQVGLAYVLKDDLLIISSPRGIEREQHEANALTTDAAPKTTAVRDQLDEPISMSFANEIPLDEVLAYITQATAKKDHAGIQILAHPLGFKEVKGSLSSILTMDVEGVPLRTTLRLLLKQLGLVYVVRDGLLIITSPNHMNLFVMDGKQEEGRDGKK